MSGPTVPRSLPYRLLLLAYPRRFRQRHGDHLLELCAQVYGEEQAARGFRLWRKVAADALVHGLAARWEARGSRRASPGRNPLAPPRSVEHATGGPHVYLEQIFRDVRHAARSLIRNPGFTVAAVATLTVSIGANTAIFSLVHSVVMQPLPFDDPDRIVRIYGSDLQEGDRYGQVSFPNIDDVRRQAQSFTAVSMVETRLPIWLNDTGAKRLALRYVHADYFEALGVVPQLGRAFTQADEGPESSASVALRHRTWVREFGADPEVIGQTINLSGRLYRVIAVLPATYDEVRLDFEGIEPDLYRPWPIVLEDSFRSGRSMAAMGRIRPDVSLEAAQAEVDAIYAGLTELYPDDNAGNGLTLVPLRESLVREFRPALMLLWGAVGILLLIGCVNIANLMLVRSGMRGDEAAIRAALGAGRGQIVRRFLAEGILLGLAGGVLGLVFARLCTRFLLTLASDVVPRVSEIPLDTTLLVFALGVSVLTGVVFGLVPALRAAPADLGGTLRARSRTATGTAGRRYGVNLLVVAEVALAVVLLTAAGLFVRSFVNLLAIDPGLDAEPVLTARAYPVWRNYADADGNLPDGALETLYGEVFRKIGAHPGVTAVGATTILPMEGGYSCDGFRPLDRPAPASGEGDCAETRTVIGSYFEAMGMTLVSGRFLDERDRGDSRPVVVINEALATRFWPGSNPVGQLLSSTHGEEMEREIVGVVANVRQFGPGVEAPMALYLPYGQDPWTPVSFAIVARTEGTAGDVAAGIRAAIREVDKDLALDPVVPMRQVVAGSIAPERFRTLLLGLFAGTAILLAIMGLYGVLASAVGQRTREIGVRSALGARPADLFALVVRNGLGLAAIGLAIGWAGAIATGRLLTRFLSGVTAGDPLTMAGVSALVLVVALWASWLPARRAARVPPAIALRAD